MDEAKWERWAAVGGLVFVATNVVGAFLPGTPPATDDPSAKITKFFADHDTAIKVQTLLLGIGVVGLLWWFGSLWRMMSRAEGERPRLTVVAAVALGLSGAVAMSAAAMTATAAFRVSELGDGTAVFFTLSNVLFGLAGFAIVAHLAAVSALNFEKKFMPAWVNIIGWIAAAAFLVGTLVIVSDANAFATFGLISFLAWCVWILAVSSFMWRGSAASSASA